MVFQSGEAQRLLAQSTGAPATGFIGASAGMTQLAPRYDRAHQDMIAGADKADCALAAISDLRQRQNVLEKASRYAQLNPSCAEAKTLAAQLCRYPGLVDGLDTLRTAMQSGKSILKQLRDIERSGEQASMDRVGTSIGHWQRLPDGRTMPPRLPFRN